MTIATDEQTKGGAMLDINSLTQEAMKRDLMKWAKWRKSDEYIHELGYPSQSAEQADAGGNDKVLPSWEKEMLVDRMIETMPIEYRRVIYGAYGIPLKLHALEVCNIFISGLTLNKKDGRYYWDRTMDRVYWSLGTKKPTFYNLLQCAKVWIRAKAYE